MEILVLGGDGFCGWPTALHLADNPENNVTIVDNLSRRRIDRELETDSLTPITSIQDRLVAWKEVAGNNKTIEYENIDIAHDYDGLLELINSFNPDTIVHFAEQRSAPYSMKNTSTKRYTIENNTLGTSNLLIAIEASKANPHLIHLGTMGVYGYGKIEKTPIPEGYLEVQVQTEEGIKKSEILYPTSPGSIYHMTKVLDQDMFASFNSFYSDKIRVTDLHQGIVWGTQTEQTRRDERLINRFDYDGDYGTVLNRFLMEAAVDYPLTVHGTGGQTRAFINIQDTVKCIELAANNPPSLDDRVAIHNQATETYKISELAKLVSKKTGAEINYIPNPRKEASENELVVVHKHLEEFGLNPITLEEGLLDESLDIAKKYAERADKSKIPATSLWNDRVPAALTQKKI